MADPTTGTKAEGAVAMQFKDKNGLVGNWYITPHAIRAYIDKVDRNATWDEAKEVLQKWSMTATYVKEEYPGISLYRSPKHKTFGGKWRWRLIVSRRKPGLPQLTTVLGGK